MIVNNEITVVSRTINEFTLAQFDNKREVLKRQR